MTTETRPFSTLKISHLLGSSDYALAVGVVVIVLLLLLPLPPVVVDVLLAANLALSIGILLLTLYIGQPMDFSVFPTLLLLVTLFRLGINIAISRLILVQGHAGKMVETFGNLILGNNYVVGVVIFLMLMIIQFVVINNGAGRVAEVAARFTLDAMPGKQLAIDADLNAGLIDEEEARRRRRLIELEADFYGSMDGASKFVKGDSIAALIIMVVNILGGFAIGVLQRGLSLMDALQSYTLLTIGAGLAIQVPALLISAASGLVVTRNASERSLGHEILGQFSNFNALVAGAAIMGLIALIPGFPKLPFLLLAGSLGGAAYWVHLAQQKAATTVIEEATAPKPEAESPTDMLEVVVVDPVELEIGYGLIPLIDEAAPDNLLRRITTLRRQLATELGLILPIVRIRDNLRLPPQAYRVKIRGQEVARGELLLDHMLAIPTSASTETLKGIPTTEPAFGLPAVWISEAESGRAELLGYTVVTPLSVLSTHLAELFRQHAPELLDRQMVQEMINHLKARSPAAVEGVVPDLISLGELQAVLRNLLSERVPIRNLAGILEVITTHINTTRDPDILAEAIRQAMAGAISSPYRDENNCLHVFTLSPQLETTLREALNNSTNGLNFQIDAALAQRILKGTAEQMEKLAQAGHYPILLCPRELRLAFRRLVHPVLPNLIVLAFSEVSPGTRVQSHGMVE